MATPTYWADKLVNKIISTRSNRREFLKATTAAGLSLSALGAIGALSGCARVAKHQVKNPLQEEIKVLMWGPSDPAEVDRLIAILDQAIKDKDPVITRAAAEGLVPHAGQDAAKRLILAYKAYKAFPEEERLQRYLIQLLALNFIVNPKARLDILRFYRAELPFRKDGKYVIPRIIFSAFMKIGLMAYRPLRSYQRSKRLGNAAGAEMREEFFAGFMLWHITAPVKELFSTPPEEGALFTFKDRFPDFGAVHEAFMKRLVGRPNALVLKDQPAYKSKEEKDRDRERYAYDEKNKADWRAVLKNWQQILENKDPEYKNEDLEKRILALLSLDENSLNESADPTDRVLVRDLLIKILNHEFELPEVKRVALSIIGSYPELLPEDQNVLVNYFLENPDNDLVLAAARGLRFRSNLPAGKILNFLARKKKEDVQLGQHLEDLLLSSLDSPDTFGALILSITMTDPKNIAGKKRRVDELRIWYLRLGDNRDEVLRQAIRFVPSESQQAVQGSFTEWLRNISMINIWRPMPMALFQLWPATQDGRMYTEQEHEAAIDTDLKNFEQIVKEL